MSNSMTPETDTMMETDAHRIEEYSAPLTAYLRMCDLARTLERERNEWRKKAVDLHKQLTTERALADRLHGALDALDFNLAFAGNTLIGGLRERVTAMRAIALPALNAWKEARSE